ncbi:MAG: ABC transporter ATP-binding protein, partial [Roseitalea porphyridii]|uniref:ABC transporter ATP-binding protein n=1 Tax=Roseitalea porphyridii TaxID=1852022 RepID=UPI0032EB7EFC
RAIRGARIGMIFQDPMTSLNPVFTVGYQVMEPLRKHMGLSKHQASDRAVELLELVGIPDARRRLGDYPHQFSGGMRQRVMIAIALACDPKVLIADEPTTALDVTIQAQILELFQELVTQMGTTLVIISHDLGVVAGLADRVAVMYGGRIVENAPVDDLFARPAHPYAEALLHSIPRVDRAESEIRPIAGRPPSLVDLPAGCSFHPRCAFAEDACRAAVPPLADVGRNRTAACIKPLNAPRKQEAMADE